MVGKNQQNYSLLKLFLVSGLGEKRIAAILKRGLNLEKIESYKDEVFYDLGLNKESISNLKNKDTQSLLEKEIEQIEKHNIQLLSILQNNYPLLLKEIYSPPPLLFYHGEIPNDEYFFVAFVGSRKFSNYGKNQTRKIIRALSERYSKIVIVSGLAYGIDAIAHQSALDFGLKTIAVLGSGLGNIYPKVHADLAKKIIAQGGAIVSEFMSLAEPKPYHFPQRNRIISGLSSAVVVMEATLKSGALITAHCAIKENREVFALPGTVDSASYQGCNSLIKQGARLLSSAEDILESFALQKFLPDILTNKAPKIYQKKESFEGKEQEILEFLHKQPASIEEINIFLKISLQETMQYITSLELKGVLREEAGGKYHPTA